MERRLKHWFHPEFRGSMHPASPSALFSPIFSRAREKIGPPEARQKRPRRNEPPQATSLILCARFFLSKPQTEFAVWVFLCKSATTSQSRLRRASIPTPFVPSGHFPLIGGIGPWKGSQGLCAPSKPSPMRGRWHGEAVTDEVEVFSLTRRCPPHPSPCGDSFPLIMRINSRNRKKMTKGARREIVRCEQTDRTLLRDLPSQ